MRLIASDEIYGAVNTEVLQELLYRYTALGKKEIGIKMVTNTLSIIHEVMPVEKEDIVLAAIFLDKHREINVRDAIHAATAMHNDFRYILSVDKHFNKIKGLQRIDPFDI